VAAGTEEKADSAREEEVRRAVFLIERLKENPPDDTAQLLALGRRFKAIPDDIRSEAISATRPAESAQTVATTLEAAVKDAVADLGSSAELASELGLSEAEVQEILSDLPADFESRVAAEAARLAQG
jgi:hypothetical protein